MKRDELYKQVWSQPLRTVAQSIGISDVALAKRCRAAHIPVPPRGWWARKQAGKLVNVPPLPPAPFVLANYFPAMEADLAVPGNGCGGGRAEQASSDTPRFRDIVEVRDEIRAAVKPIKVPSELSAPHSAVARLLRQDAERKATAEPDAYYGRNAKKFASPIQQRRLRILSSIFRELERLGCKISGATHAGERFSINVGGAWTYILFGIEGGSASTYFYPDRKGPKASDRPQLRFDIVEFDNRNPPLQTWRENQEPLERQASEIVRGLLLRTEDETRHFALQKQKWKLEEDERKRAEAARPAKPIETKSSVAAELRAPPNLEALLNGADAFERAARIRRYVAAVNAAFSEEGSAEQFAECKRWAEWALEQADRIDPVVSRAFMSEIKL